MTARITCPVFEHAAKHGGQSAVVGKDRSLSYQQLEGFIDLAAENLKRLGVKPRERVALISPNTVEYIITLFALWRQGAIACLLTTRLPEDGVRSSLQNISCARIISPVEISIPGTRTFRGKDEVRFPGIEYVLDAPADIMFTSGSSGEPKAVQHAFGNHYYNAQAANEHIPFGPGDRWLLSLPLYHVGGLGIVWRTFYAGGTLVVPEAEADLADSLRKFRITHVSLVPTQLYRLLSDSKNIAVLREMKAILVGGSAVPDVLILKAVDARLPVHVTYGLTEMASQVATSKRLTKEDSLPRGQILRCAQARISDDHEILVRGKTLFQGYFTTTAPGVVVASPALDKEGWFHTGDLGCLNEDGTLTVLGREDNMFISGGENIQPEEIERHLCRIEGVLQAVVVPVEHEEFGERPVAFVEIQEDALLSRTQILSCLREYLPSFKLPDQIYFWPATAQTGIKPDRAYFLRLIKETSSLKTIF